MLRTPLLLALALTGLTAVACSDPSAKPEAKGTASGSASAASASVAEAAAKELDTSKLTAREKKELVGQLADVGSPCADVPGSLAACLAEKKSCKACKPAADYLARLVRQGMPKPDRQKVYEARFDPKAVKAIDLGQAAVKGPSDAVVTIVEWGDFECPHCAMMREILDLFLERFPGQVRVAFKLYALPSHSHAKDASLAAIAAQNQGKFPEMHAILFQNQSQLERQDLLRYAKDVGLDMPKFKADFEDDATLKRLEVDMKQADELGLDGTPLIYVNGRKVMLEALNPFFDEFEAWLKLEIELAGKTPAEPSEKYKELMAKAEEAAKRQPSPEELEKIMKELEAAGSASAGAAPSAAPSAGPKASAAPSAGPAKK